MAEILNEELVSGKKKFSKITVIMLWLAMLIFAGHACTHMVAAGDTWVALACGRHFVNHGVNTVEPFSFMSHKAGPTDAQLETYPQWSHGIIKKVHPTGWINQNWLTHVIFYKLVTWFGSEDSLNYDALVYWKFAIYLIALVCIYFTSRLLGASQVSSAFFSCAAMFLSRSFLDIRPAGFSNLLVPVMLLILVLATYRSYKYLWLIVPTCVFWANVHGGYLYAFIVMGIFFVINLAVYLLKSERLIAIEKKMLTHVVIVGAVAFIAMAVFNPYHLTNLTHTFIITISKHAEDWRKVNEWHSALEFSNLVGDSMPFVVFFGVFWAFLALWIFACFLKPSYTGKEAKKAGLDMDQGYCWPRLDIAYVAIVIFTLFMAIKSRRFIPIAAFVACPFVAMITDQFWQMVSARINLNRKKVFAPASFSKGFEVCVVAITFFVIVGFGGWCGYKYKTIYLNPWPNDARFSSVFMRMTASYLKPFDACKFLRDNQLKGRMLNYWTEGGFVAFGETPDSQTGEIPLKLFMDGRAQAAFDIETFNLYNGSILSGGELGQQIKSLVIQGKRSYVFSKDEKKQMGDDVQMLLDKYDVWLVLMPKSQFRLPLMQGIEQLGNWRLVYYDGSQKMLADVNKPAGRELWIKSQSGQTIYPSRWNELIMQVLLDRSRAINKAESFAKLAEAFEISDSPIVFNMLLNIGDSDHERNIFELARSIADNYTNNREQILQNDGYKMKMISAMMSAGYVASKGHMYGVSGVEYKKLEKEISDEMKKIDNVFIW